MFPNHENISPNEEDSCCFLRDNTRLEGEFNALFASYRSMKLGTKKGQSLYMPQT